MLSVEKLKHLRLLQNLSQSNIANVLGVSKNYISMLENRKQNFSEDFYTRWLNAIYKLSSMSPSQQKEYINRLKEEAKKEIDKNKINEEIKTEKKPVKRITKNK